jgi:hypothetical protein
MRGRLMEGGIIIFGEGSLGFGGFAGESLSSVVGKDHYGGTGLLGVLGMGARIPYGILELGSRTGSVPSWQGGKFSFGA